MCVHCALDNVYGSTDMPQTDTVASRHRNLFFVVVVIRIFRVNTKFIDKNYLNGRLNFMRFLARKHLI